MADLSAFTQSEAIATMAVFLTSRDGKFHIEDLAVALANEDARFRLTRHPFPDINRVQALIYGKKGLLASGWIERIGDRWFKATDKALKQFRECEREGPTDHELSLWQAGNKSAAMLLLMKRRRVDAKEAARLLER